MSDLGLTEPANLEKWLASTGERLFDRKVLWIARQDRAADDKRSDLIGIDDHGNLVVAELKRGTVGASAVTQALSYAAEYVQKTADDLAEMFSDHSGAHRKSELVRVAESEDDAAQQLSDHVGDETELNESQILILVGEEFAPDVLAICDYLNQSSGDATFSVECWRARIYQEAEDALYLALEQLLPQPSVRAAIEQRREEAKSKKRARDPARRRFVSDLLGFLRSNGFDAHRAQGQSYGFAISEPAIRVDFGRHTPHPRMRLPPECEYDDSTFPPELNVERTPGADGKGDLLILRGITRGPDAFSPTVGQRIVSVLQNVSATRSAGSNRSEERAAPTDGEATDGPEMGRSGPPA